MSLALWLRAGRAERGLSLDDVARVTKIQPRILERLEGGSIQPGDGLPAEVFVRGFIRSYAKCCGLDEAEAISRYSAAAQGQAISPAPTTSTPPAARAMVEAMADLAPQVARTTSPNMLAVASAPAIELVELASGSLPEIAVPAAELAAEASTSSEARPSYASKKKRRGGKRAKRKSMATGTPSTPTPVVAAPVEVEPVVETPVVETPVAFVDTKPETIETIDATADVVGVPVIVDHLDPLVEPVGDNDDVVATEIWQPKMPSVTTASVPWRRPAYVAPSTAAASVPTLVIDDADPEHAAQLMEDREAAKSVLTNAQRRSFLPPILLDREDRSARQGGLTLAVIILLIAATLTLSYLMRRPSSSGDGVTVRNVETQLIG